MVSKRQRKRLDDFGKPYDEDDLRAIDTLLGDGLTIKQIALRLGRSPAGIRSKLYRRRHAA